MRLFCKIALLGLACSLFVKNVCAQTFELRLQDNEGYPVVGAHVFYNCLDKNPHIVVSNVEGVAKLESSCFPLFISVSFLGKKNYHDTLYQATNKTYNLDDDDEYLQTVTVTAQYLPQESKNASNDVTIISQKEISQSAANNLRELLISKSNIQVAQDNILGTGISLQGVGGENIKILIDGVPVIGRQNGNVDISQINLSNIEQVEIIEGPLSALFGSEALGGVINLITKKSIKERFNINAQAYYEHVGVYNVDAGLGTHFGNFTVTANFGRHFFDGFSAPDTSRWQQWKPREQYFADGSLLFKNKKWDVQLSGDWSHDYLLSKGQLRAPFYINAFDDHFKTRRYSLKANATFLIGKDKSLEARVSYANYKRTKNTYFKDLTTLAQNLTENSSDQDTTGFNETNARLMYSFFAPQKKLTYQTGVEYSIEQGSGQRIKDHLQKLEDYAFFASFEYKPHYKLLLKPSVRIGYNSVYKTPVTPSLNIKYNFRKGMILRASYARGFRTPSIKELYFDFVDINHNIVGNTNLKAETSHNVQLSFNWFKQMKRHYLDFSQSFYYNDINNQIVLSSLDLGTTYSYYNISNRKTLGTKMEFQHRYQSLVLNYSLNLTGIYTRLSDTVASNEFAWMPAAGFSANYTWKKTGLNFNFIYKYNGKTPGIYVVSNSKLSTYTNSDYHWIECSVGRAFWKKRIDLTIGGKNLANVRNISSSASVNDGGNIHSSTQNLPVGWGASFFARLKINLDL